MKHTAFQFPETGRDCFPLPAGLSAGVHRCAPWAYPCLDDLMLAEPWLDASHLGAHHDFSRNNQNSMWLSRTNRKQMICKMVNSTTRNRRYHERYDLDRVEH
ncbi:MAG: hypothetical protein IID38_08665 [Planctomycetes bacterium]|nr:hypothetical protein [Planctomycetota bacterium]